MYEHPFVPGSHSAIEPGPWHYGADYVAVYFRGEPEKVSKLIPAPYKATDGSGIAYVCEIISVSETGAAMVSEDPDRTAYSEAAIGIRCSANGTQGIFYPVMWVDTEWSLLRGLLNGYQKRLADKIRMTRLHPLNPKLGPMGPGMVASGFCVKGADRTLSVRVTVGREGVPGDLPSFGPTFGMRRFPTTNPTQAQVDEPVEILKSNSRASDVWLGTGSMGCSIDLGKATVTSGAVYRSGFTISGSKVLG